MQKDISNNPENYFNEEMNLYLNNTKNNNINIIGIYYGSFDPFHEGHREVARVAIDNYCNKLICVAMPYNKYKPNISCHVHRYNLLNIGLSSDKDIYVINNTMVNTDINKIITAIRQQFNEIIIVGIIGSDIYSRYINEKKMPSMNVDKFLVVPRQEFIINYEHKNPQFIFMDYLLFKRRKGTTLSATEIRRNIYTGKSVNDNLNLNSQLYIKNNIMYCDINNFITKKILGNNLFINKSVPITQLTRPYSGNIVYEIRNGTDPHNIIKIFPKINVNKGKLEIEMLKWMKNNNISTADILYSHYDSKICIIIMNKISAISFKSACDILCVDKIYKQSILIGKILRRIHDYQYVEPTDKYINYWLKRINPQIPYKHLIKDIGKFSFKLHGDFNLTNILIDNDTTYLIDPDAAKYPGPPAYDYYRFISCIKKLNKDLICTIEEGFKLGYGKLNFTDSANIFFSCH